MNSTEVGSVEGGKAEGVFAEVDVGFWMLPSPLIPNISSSK